MNDHVIDSAIDTVIKENFDRQGAYSQARDILRQIKDTEQILTDLNIRIEHMKEQLISTLSGEIRKRQPKLDIGLKKGRCHAGYRANNIVLSPDFDSGVWKIEGSLGSRFMKEFPHLSNMTNDIVPLAHAIADYFGSRYKTLSI